MKENFMSTFKLNGEPKDVEVETRFFASKRVKWATDQANKFALVKGIKLIGFYDTLDEAFETGLRKFDEKPFLVKQVTADNS